MMHSKLISSVLFITTLLNISKSFAGEIENYVIDNTHSFVNFTIRHVVSKTSGTFADVNGKISLDRTDLSKSSVHAVINVDSINTNHAKRDQNIKNKAGFLDAKKFTEIRFDSLSASASKADEFNLTGTFNLHGISKEITFPVKVLGYGMDPWGGNRVGFEAHTKILASDFGFTWTKDNNGAIGDEIDITLLIEAIKIIPEVKPW